MKRAIKRLTAVLLAVIITAGLFTSAFAVLRGDVDLNGKINSLDALRILRYNVQLDTEIDEKIADINGDSKINSLDALGVLRVSVGLDEESEVEDDDPSAPSSVADIVAMYNDAVNKVVSDKAGYTKQRTTTVTHLDAGKYTSMAGDIVKEFLGEGTSEFKNSKGNSKYLAKASLTADDVTSAVCQKTGSTYTITLDLKNGTSSYTSKKAEDKSPVAKTGLLSGNQLNPEYDYLNSASINAGIKSKGAKANSVSTETINTKIVVTIDAESEKMLSYTASFDLEVSIEKISVAIISVPSAEGKAHTAVVLSDFKW